MTGNSQDLAIDLDGTLLLVDTLDEGFARAVTEQPLNLFRTLAWLTKGPAFVKEKLRQFSCRNIDTMPAREDLLAWLNAERAKGRKLHLVTAADHEVAHAAAQRFGLFDSVIATRDGRNLKGASKRNKLKEMFPDGFSYVGDSSADLRVFEAADTIVLAGASPDVAKAARKLNKPIEAEFQMRDRSTLKLWLKALRVHQWSKNLLLFIPLMLGHAFTNPASIVQTVLGFLLMGLVASATYIFNDISDLANDRAHPTKRNRPFASGALPVRHGLIAMGVLGTGGFAGAIALSPIFAALLALYVITTVAYSMALKRIALLDISILAFLYYLRLAIGAALAMVPLSIWLSAFALFFFFSLSLAKRHAEIVKMDPTQPKAMIPGRGYLAQDSALTLPLGLATAACAMLILVLFLAFEATQGRYARPDFLWPAPAIVALWTMRVWLLSSRGELRDDPVSFAVTDRVSLALGAVLLATAVAAL